MKYDNVAIPAGAGWSSPFARWQGTLASMSSLDLAINVTARALRDRALDPSWFDGIIVGSTVPQNRSFFGPTSIATGIGATDLTGPTVSQACATSIAALDLAAGRVTGGSGPILVTIADRTSNGPLLVFPQPESPGGSAMPHNWVLDNFESDPTTDIAILATAENTARDAGITRGDLDALTAMRSEQYERSLADDRSFQRRYMVPVEVRRGRNTSVLDADEGVRLSSLEVLSGLRSAAPDGLHSFAAQTHPADGAAGVAVTDVERAREVAQGEGVVSILATSFVRAPSGTMPTAPVPAAAAALRDAGLEMSSVDAVTTHNPFAVNDIYFSQQTGFPLDRMNAYGSSLIFGHPQGPTGMRALVELIEELRIRGGGVGLFTGCAAGDTGNAVIVKVHD